ncbi:MAG: endonuclease/exonuclease/phosphatase family protein [Prosthecobacter sp.]|nr:endonuclease/exonuclease/phosphatase family protein [Prosthecobacter sp.]
MLWKALRILGWVMLLLGIALQLGLRDRHPAWTLLFYAMPRPCLAALALALAWICKNHPFLRTTALALAAAISLGWLGSSWQPRLMPSALPAHGKPPPAAGPHFTLLFWNLCRPRGLHPQAVQLIQQLKPDIAAFVEPGPAAGTLLTEYEARLPGYQAAWMPRGILWLSRLPSRYRERGKLEGAGAYARFEVQGLGAPFPIVVGDVLPHLFHPRTQQLRELLAQAQGRPDAILVGDLNTPLESVHFDAWRARYQNALESRPRLLRETWPCGLPLLSLDQAWVGPAWEILEVRKVWRLTGSDHAALWLHLQRR